MKSSYVPFFVFTGIIAFFLIAFIVNRNMGGEDEEENIDDTGSGENNGENA